VASYLGKGTRKMKTRLIETAEEANALVAELSRSAGHAIEQLQVLILEQEGLQVLESIKFQRIGCDPLDIGRPLNLVEQVNQTFTYLASAKAVKKLIMLHPTLVPFTVNLGTAPGSDIASANGELAAEVFAAVNTSSNRKLANDLHKVSQTAATFKYVFFMCPGIEPGRQPKLEREPGVEVWSLGQ
jgi:hypothetical protein